jgi:hypothetical protein
LLSYFSPDGFNPHLAIIMGRKRLAILIIFALKSTCGQSQILSWRSDSREIGYNDLQELAVNASSRAASAFGTRQCHDIQLEE